MHAQVLRLRRVFRRLAILRCLPCCLPHSRTRSARGTMQISELNGWPACSPCPCHTQDVTVLSVGFGAEWLARPFSYDSFIRYSRPVYPGAFPAPAPAPAPAPGLRVPSTLAGRVGNGDLALFAEPGTKRIGRKRQGSRWAAFCSAPLVTSRLRSRQAGRSTHRGRFSPSGPCSLLDAAGSCRCKRRFTARSSHRRPLVNCRSYSWRRHWPTEWRRLGFSCISPHRSNATAPTMNFLVCSSLAIGTFMGVKKGPGQIALHVMPKGASSRPNARVI